MPVSTALPTLTQGLLRLFDPKMAPTTTAGAAQAWAEAYVAYLIAGGLPGAKAKKSLLASLLTTAFQPTLAGGGPVLFIQALAAFWPGIPVPAQSGVAIAFTPLSPNVNSPQPPTATPQQQANGLAQIIHGLTLGGVKVQVPPGAVVPLL